MFNTRICSNIVFPSLPRKRTPTFRFFFKTFCALLISTNSATCPVHLILDLLVLWHTNYLSLGWSMRSMKLTTYVSSVEFYKSWTCTLTTPCAFIACVGTNVVNFTGIRATCINQQRLWSFYFVGTEILMCFGNTGYKAFHR